MGSVGSRCSVLRDVGGAAERVAAVLHAHHRDRRFRRDAIRIATEVDVEHGVADDRNAAGARASQEMLKAGAMNKSCHVLEDSVAIDRERV